MKKRIIALALAALTALSAATGVMARTGGDGWLSACSMGEFYDRCEYYHGQFSDVDEGAWYGTENQGVVAQAVRLGIMNGMGDGSFSPDGCVTIAEALKMACVVHNLYSGAQGQFQASSPWYQTYVDYAQDNGIIAAGMFSGSYEEDCTRGEMAYIFSGALPVEELAAINEISSLPDVSAATLYSDNILLLYRAGVLTGNDAYGTFAPYTKLTRAAAAAIISRVALPKLRRSLSLVTGDAMDFDTYFAMYSIDSEYEEAMKTAFTTYDMVSTETKYGEMWESFISYAYEQLQRHTNGSEYEELLSDREYWYANSDAGLQAEIDYFNQYEATGGTMDNISRAGIYYSFYMDKGKQLAQSLYVYDQTFWTDEG